MTQRIAYANSGDVLSARYLNRIVDGANRALDVLGPPRSTREGGSGTVPVDLDANGDPILGNEPDDGALAFLGFETLTEISRAVSTVRVFDPTDAAVFVDVERIERLKLASAIRVLTMIFENTE